jgi:hypothetical protein
MGNKISRSFWQYQSRHSCWGLPEFLKELSHLLMKFLWFPRLKRAFNWTHGSRVKAYPYSRTPRAAPVTRPACCVERAARTRTAQVARVEQLPNSGLHQRKVWSIIYSVQYSGVKIWSCDLRLRANHCVHHPSHPPLRPACLGFESRRREIFLDG